MRQIGTAASTNLDNTHGKSHFPGTGFGLTNVRERIVFLGGKMNIETPADGGLRVVLQMPLEAQARAPEVPA